MKALGIMFVTIAIVLFCGLVIYSAFIINPIVSILAIILISIMLGSALLDASSDLK